MTSQIVVKDFAYKRSDSLSVKSFPNKEIFKPIWQRRRVGKSSLNPSITKLIKADHSLFPSSLDSIVQGTELHRILSNANKLFHDREYVSGTEQFTFKLGIDWIEIPKEVTVSFVKHRDDHPVKKRLAWSLYFNNDKANSVRIYTKTFLIEIFIYLLSKATGISETNLNRGMRLNRKYNQLSTQGPREIIASVKNSKRLTLTLKHRNSTILLEANSINNMIEDVYNRKQFTISLGGFKVCIYYSTRGTECTIFYSRDAAKAIPLGRNRQTLKLILRASDIKIEEEIAHALEKASNAYSNTSMLRLCS